MIKPARITLSHIIPPANIRGTWARFASHPLRVNRNPSHWPEVLSAVAVASSREVRSAAEAASETQRSWEESSLTERIQVLKTWLSNLKKKQNELAELMCAEVGKPFTQGLEEVRFAKKLLQATISLLEDEGLLQSRVEKGIFVRRRPLGVVGIITPWNNPVAIPVGKLGPAIGFGNAVLWKPALRASRTSTAVLESLGETGIPAGLVNFVFGERETARRVIMHSLVRAISFTGSNASGSEVARLCGRLMKPVQLELGGNNGCLVMADSEVGRAARDLAVSAFSFAGQRCTAPRRFIVHKDVYEPFRQALVRFVSALRLGNPSEPQTQVGPVISRKKQLDLRRIVQKALQQGAKLLLGGNVPGGLESGCWFEPTVIEVPHHNLSIVQEETFGPIAVLQAARDLDEALQFLNGVRHGLIASLYSQAEDVQRRFLEEATCGVLKFNRTTLGVAPGAPFQGWKASGLGPSKHGCGDIEFYLKLQTIYR